MASQPRDKPANGPSINSSPEPYTAPESIKPKILGESTLGEADLAALYAATNRLDVTMEWDPLLVATMDAATQLVHADDALLILADEATHEFYIAAAPHLPHAVATRARVQMDEGDIAQVVQRREPRLLIGQTRLAGCPELFSPGKISSIACAPLYSPKKCDETELLGALVLIRHRGAPDLTERDVRRVAEFCVRASTALQNARCYRQMEHRAVLLKNLIEISQSLIASLQVDVVLRTIIDRAVELLSCQAGSLLLVDPDTDELVFKVAVGPAGAALVGTRLPPNVGIVGAVARDAVPLIVNDAKADPRHYGAVDASTAQETRSLLCVPLTNKGHTLGVIEVVNKVNGIPFDDEDCDLLSTFAVQGAIAIENAQLYTDLRNTFADTVRIIANAVEARDPYTWGHTGRVTQLALKTAREMGWSHEQLEILEIGGLLHDIGKIGISDTILYKPTELTEDEKNEMKRHPVVGAKMLEGVAALRPMLPCILYHQERFDGAGYPFGLKGDEIPLEARILAAVDSFDAMTSDRPYRKGLSEEQANVEILRNRGTQFDPNVVDALMRVLSHSKLTE